MRALPSFELGPITVNPNRLLATAFAGYMALYAAGCSSNSERPDNVDYYTTPPAVEQPVEEIPSYETPTDPIPTDSYEDDDPDYSDPDEPYAGNADETEPKPNVDKTTTSSISCAWSPYHPQPSPHNKPRQRIVNADCIDLSDGSGKAFVYASPNAAEANPLGKVPTGTKVTAACAVKGQKLTNNSGIKDGSWMIVTLPEVRFEDGLINESAFQGNVIVPAGAVGYNISNLPNCTPDQLAEVKDRQ